MEQLAFDFMKDTVEEQFKAFITRILSEPFNGSLNDFWRTLVSNFQGHKVKYNLEISNQMGSLQEQIYLIRIDDFTTTIRFEYR